MRPHNVLLTLLFAVVLGAAHGQVRVKFRVLDGTPAATTVANQLLNDYKNGLINNKFAYQILTLTMDIHQSQVPRSLLSSASGNIPGLLAVCSLFYFMTRSKYSSFWLFIGLMLCNNMTSALIGTYSNCKLLNDEIQYKLHWSIK